MSSMATSMGVEMIWGGNFFRGRLRLNTAAWAGLHLLLVDDVDARLDVREGVGGGEDGLALVLLVQVPVRPPVQREGGAVDEAPEVVVLVKVSDAVLHFVGVEVRLHVRDLDEGLRNGTVHEPPVPTCRAGPLLRPTLFGSSLHLSTGFESLMTSTWSSPKRSP